MFDAVLFDLDGTLVETEAIAQAAGRQAFAAMGIDVPQDFLDSMVGKDRPTCDRMMAATFPGLDVAALNRVWHAAFATGMAAGLPLRPGAAEILGALRLPVAIVTSSTRAEAAMKLGLTGLDRLVGTVIALEDVARPKPDPAPYLTAAARLGVSPARCLVFEDSEPGAEAAWRAGTCVVHVPDTVPASGRWAHHVAPSLIAGARAAGLPLPGLQASETI